MNGQSLQLSQQEFILLKTLLNNQGTVLTHQQLLDTINIKEANQTYTIIEKHIENLRKKTNINLTQTIMGTGYTIRQKVTQ